MREVCIYNPKTDIEPVDVSLVMDLAKCVQSGTIVDVGENNNYNGIEHLDNVGHRVESSFEAIDKMRSLKKAAKAAEAAKAAKSTPSGEGA